MRVSTKNSCPFSPDSTWVVGAGVSRFQLGAVYFSYAFNIISCDERDKRVVIPSPRVYPQTLLAASAPWHLLGEGHQDESTRPSLPLAASVGFIGLRPQLLFFAWSAGLFGVHKCSPQGAALDSLWGGCMVFSHQFLPLEMGVGGGLSLV